MATLNLEEQLAKLKNQQQRLKSPAPQRPPIAPDKFRSGGNIDQEEPNPRYVSRGLGTVSAGAGSYAQSSGNYYAGIVSAVAGAGSIIADYLGY